MKRKKQLSLLGTGIFTILSLFYILPIFIVLFNSFKKKAFINLEPFKLPTEKNFVGWDNYEAAINQYGLLDAVGWTVFITVGSVLVILVCTSMCAWYITRVQDRFTKAVYLLCVFSMVVPNGDVHTGSCGRPFEAEHALGHHYCLSRIRGRACCIYVLRLCKIHSFRN